MAKTTKSAAATQAAREVIEQAIGKNVMKKLGAPPDFDMVITRTIDNTRARVNVFVSEYKEGETTVIRHRSIRHSFFVHVTEDGEITASDPPLKKLY